MVTSQQFLAKLKKRHEEELAARNQIEATYTMTNECATEQATLTEETPGRKRRRPQVDYVALDMEINKSM